MALGQYGTVQYSTVLYSTRYEYILFMYLYEYVCVLVCCDEYRYSTRFTSS